MVICCAVTLMLSATLYGIVYGETSVENQDNENYRLAAMKYNAVEFVNIYDCGFVVIALSQLASSDYSRLLLTRKWKNLLFFFHIEEGG
jgi:hypothetical protein